MADSAQLTPIQQKQNELADLLRREGGGYNPKLLEQGIQEAVNAPTPAQANVKFASLINKIAKNQPTPRHADAFLAKVATTRGELDQMTAAATAAVSSTAASSASSSSSAAASSAAASSSSAGGSARAASGAVSAPAAAPGAMPRCDKYDPPRGFRNKAQYDQAMEELRGALDDIGLSYTQIGVRGSSVTGKSATKGTKFDGRGRGTSDIDVFFILDPSEPAPRGLTTSESIPGFIHPGKVTEKYPDLARWSEKWGGILKRDIEPGAFTSRSKLNEASSRENPYILHKRAEGE